MDEKKSLIPQENSDITRIKSSLAKRGLQIIDEFDQEDIGEIGSKKHIEAVHRWLKAHVKRYTANNNVTLFDFKVDWETFSGSFRVLFDNQECSERIKFGPDVTGRYIIYPPMFTSPLGAPCSYATIEFSEREEEAILKGLHQTIPKLKPFGIDKESGTQIYANTPIKRRIRNIEDVETARAKLEDSTYSITTAVEST